jgi:hypothetical protein
MYFSQILQSSIRNLSPLHIDCVLLFFHYGTTVMWGLCAGIFLQISRLH